MYQDSLALREKVLRKPLGLEVSSEQIKNESLKNYHHYCVKKDNAVVAALTMKINPSSIQICQIATLNNYQCKGYGSAVLEYAEKELSRLFPKKGFVVFSRINSVSFYLKMGYEFKNKKTYTIIGLDHRLMKKTVTKTMCRV